MDRVERGRDRTQVTPEPVNPKLFEWLESLFEGNDQKPEKIEVRQAYGPSCRKYGTTVAQKEFKANQPKPSREQLVAMSNEFVDRAQTNCNAIQRAHKYGVCAKHYAKSEGYYEAFVISLKPTQKEGYDGTEDDDDDDLSVSARDAKRRDALLTYSLDHLKEGNENRRWEQDQFARSMDQILGRYDTMLDRQSQRIEHLEGRFIEFFKATEEALSKKHERDLAAEMQKFRMAALTDGLQFVKQLLPVAVNKLTGKETIPTQETPESIAISTFLKGLSGEQARTLFGDVDEKTNKPLGNGIFTPDQAELFAGVAQCQIPPSELDKLFSGETAINQEQISKAQGVVSPQQFMPLFALFVERQKKSLEANSSTGS